VLVSCSQLASLADGDAGKTALSIAVSKGGLIWSVVLARGILCNALVCVAVWLAMGSRSVADKILAILFPITAFVTLGLEHSIANWFFLSYGVLLDSTSQITATSMAINLVASTIGNLIGGTLLVAAIYWTAYLRTAGSDH
jgi:formate/nitrite transporter FocA (FNT family)